MGKSPYSLILSDDVVSQIDLVAYRNGTSRSNMINQILAEYVSYVTPEKRLNDIYSRAMELISQLDQMQVMLTSSERMLSLKSALRYKYNPTIHYSIELCKSGDPLGEMKVSARTQNTELINLMSGFFSQWDREERNAGLNPQACWGGGKYMRRLEALSRSVGVEELASELVRYVQAFDRSMKDYFLLSSQSIDPAEAVKEDYELYLRTRGELF